MKKSTKQLILLTTATLYGMHLYNKYISDKSKDSNSLSEKEGHFYDWTHGRIFYNKSGSGSPLLLIHDTECSSSAAEWKKVRHALSKEHTVYTLDLIGCGRSDKPAIKYTNYIYVQLINSFINDVIKDRVHIVATNYSSSFVLMLNNMCSDMINKMIFINPTSLSNQTFPATKCCTLRQNIINLPIVGTFIYNLLNTKTGIKERFQNKYYSSHSTTSASNIEDAYYTAAHLGDNKGKYLYSSFLGKYMYVDARKALSNTDTPIHIIASRDLYYMNSVLKDFKSYNPNIEITQISGDALYPQLECSSKISNIINNNL